MKILFVGNNCIFNNDLPDIIKKLFEYNGKKTHITILCDNEKASLFRSHYNEIELNVRHGEYDCIILHHSSENFDVRTFNDDITYLYQGCLADTGIKTILLLPWVAKNDFPAQDNITSSYCELKRNNGFDIIPVGEVFRRIERLYPLVKLYAKDDINVSRLGTYIISVTLFYTLSFRKRTLCMGDDYTLNKTFEIDRVLSNDIHSEACRISRMFNS